MEKIYREYKDIAEFRIVYIREAHAADSKKSRRFAEIKNIMEHKDYGQRCSTAKMMITEENITIPCIVDKMNNEVSKAYKALPDRLYVVRKDGRIGIAADRGPRGFKPALQETKEWLAQFSETGEEPELP